MPEVQLVCQLPSVFLPEAALRYYAAHFQTAEGSRGTRRELLAQLTAAVPAECQAPAPANALSEWQYRIEDYKDREPEYMEAPEEEWAPDEYVDEDFVPDEEPKYEVGPTIGKPWAGKGVTINVED